MLKVGDKAPDFNLYTGAGNLFRLSEELKRNNVVLYFYPKDNTRGCVAEACGFRDLYESFKEKGTEVVGISSDSTGSHQNFTSKFNLPFILLSDPENAVRKMYKVPRIIGLVPGRVTFVINKAGIILYAFNSLIRPTEHVTNTLEIIKTLKS